MHLSICRDAPGDGMGLYWRRWGKGLVIDSWKGRRNEARNKEAELSQAKRDSSHKMALQPSIVVYVPCLFMYVHIHCYQLNQTPSFIYHPSPSPTPPSLSLSIAHLHLRIHHLVKFLIHPRRHSLLIGETVNLYRYPNEEISPSGTNQ